MKCDYCGKESDASVSTYISGKQVSFYCSVSCHTKACKKITRILKKMTREELLSFIKNNKAENKEVISDSLFNDLPKQSKALKRCKECKHIQKWQCGGSFFFYCGITRSRRTQNGLKKVLCKTPACGLFEKNGHRSGQDE